MTTSAGNREAPALYDDLRTLRHNALAIVAAQVALIGWAWLVYTLVDMGPQVVLPVAIAPAVLFIGGVLALDLNRRSITAATLLLVCSLAIASFSMSWLSFASLGPYSFSLVVSIIGLLLSPAAGLLSAVPCAALIVVAGNFGARGPLPAQQIIQPVVLVCLTALLSCLSASNLYQAMRWAWENADVARQRLEEARDRQQVLNRTLRSLDEMYALVLRARREEAAARRQAEEGQALKGQFAANVSHELRTPLNAIIGFSELMHTAPEVYGDFPWPGALRSDVNEIYRNARHLQSLIDDILDLSQVDAMRMPLAEEEVQIGNLIRDAVSAASGLVRGRDVRLEVQVEPDLPTLWVDITRIRQVLLNLLSNAGRFTEHGAITVSASREDHVIHVRVADTGIGMSPEQLSRAFKEFEQADGSLRRRYGGTGLGLAISKRFVELHGGRIWAESALGVGSTFHFTLPVSSAGRLAALTHTPERTAGASQALQVKTVILQGSSDSGLRLLDRYISGYHFVPSANTEETLTLVAKEHPWAVLVAAETPDEVEQVAHRLADLHPTLSLPVLSYRKDVSGLSQLPGHIQWLSKPVQRKALLTTLARMVPAGRNLLLVDDDPAEVQLLARMLRSAEKEYLIREAYGGREALEAIAASPPDAMLLDLMMPGMSGLQVIEQLQARPDLAALPILMVTAGDVSAHETPIDVPNVSGLGLVKSDGLKTQEWLVCIRGLLDAVSPRYVDAPDISESQPAGRSG